MGIGDKVAAVLSQMPCGSQYGAAELGQQEKSNGHTKNIIQGMCQCHSLPRSSGFDTGNLCNDTASYVISQGKGHCGSKGHQSAIEQQNCHSHRGAAALRQHGKHQSRNQAQEYIFRMVLHPLGKEAVIL